MLWKLLRCNSNIRTTGSNLSPFKLFRTDTLKLFTVQNSSFNDAALPKNAMPSFIDVVLPEQRKLPLLPKLPVIYMNTKPPRLRRSDIDVKGPEKINNKLIHKQYGIMALSGGYMLHSHYEIIRNEINKGMDAKKTFAVWRIDPLWKPRTKKSVGKTMGGGKANVHHYATPIKAGRIIVEVGGKVEFSEVYTYLNRIVNKMPFDSLIVNEEILRSIEEEEEYVKKRNINPFSYEYAIKKNLNGYAISVSPRDREWHGKYI